MKVAPVAYGEGSLFFVAQPDAHDTIESLQYFYQALGSFQNSDLPRFSAAANDDRAPVVTQAYDDSRALKGHAEAMTDITRDELRDTLSAIEERMDKRIERIEKNTDQRSEDLRREIGLRDEALQRDTAALRELLKVHAAHTEEMGARLERQFAEAKSAIGAQKYWLAGIGVAVVLGIMGANATIFSGGKAFFDSGVDHAAVKQLLEETKAQSRETRALLESLKSQQATPPTPAPPAPAPTKP